MSNSIRKYIARAIWLVIAPAILAVVAVRFLIPSPASGEQGGAWMEWLARMGNAYTLYFAIALFLLFSTLLRYWHFILPGGAYLADEKGASRSAWSTARTALTVALAAIAAVLVRSRVVESYRVLSDSMLPTLAAGDAIGARPHAGESHRGDVIVFQNPNGSDPPHLVKRVIGLPGDRITMRGGHPIINGWQIPSCDAGTYINPLSSGGGVHGRLVVEFLESQIYLTVHTPVTKPFEEGYDVKPGELFVLGDNRNNSSDSRAWNDGHGGGVAMRAIEARVTWFLLGSHRDKTTDFSRMFEKLGVRLHLDGVDIHALEAGIAKCLEAPPSETHPPDPAPLAHAANAI